MSGWKVGDRVRYYGRGVPLLNDYAVILAISPCGQAARVGGEGMRPDMGDMASLLPEDACVSPIAWPCVGESVEAMYGRAR